METHKNGFIVYKMNGNGDDVFRGFRRRRRRHQNREKTRGKSTNDDVGGL